MVMEARGFPPLVAGRRPRLIPGMPDSAASARILRLSTPRTARCAVLGPTDPDAVRSLWIVVHGYAQLAADFVRGFAPVDDGSRRIVAPEALSRFYAPVGGDVSVAAHREAPVGASWMTREDRLEEIADYVAWMQRAYEASARELAADVPVTVLGFSQGATAASRWVASGAVPAARLICWGASLAPELDLGPASPLRRVRVAIVVGDRDRFVPAAAIEAERARLAAADFPAELVTFPGGHRLDDPTLVRFAQEDR